MQGFNMGRYRPPDSDPRRQSFNSHSGVHPLGKRARGLKSRRRERERDDDDDDGRRTGSAASSPSSSSSAAIAASDGLTVRFELPLPVWCAACSALLPQGTRYNARKHHAGFYHSTPIWAFVCRCRECAAEFEVRTDPAHTRYVVVRGGREKVESWERTAHDDAEDHTMAGRVFEVDKERALQRRSLCEAVVRSGGEDTATATATTTATTTTGGDPLAALDRAASRSRTEAQRTQRTLELERLASARAADPYSLNGRLRAALRGEKRKRAERQAREDEERRALGWNEGRRVILRGDDDEGEGEGQGQGQDEETRRLWQEERGRALRDKEADRVKSLRYAAPSSSSSKERNTGKTPHLHPHPHPHPHPHIDDNPAAKKLAQAILSRGTGTPRRKA